MRQQIFSAPLRVEGGLLPVRPTPGLAEIPVLPERTAVMEVTGS
jgi:hypothetical protein